MPRVYLDWNATAPLRPEAAECLRRHLAGPPGNASSIHAFGREARMIVETARARVAALLGARPAEIVFTASGTEANNLALYGMARSAPAGRRRIVASAFEHPSVGRVLDDLEMQGFDVVRIAPDGDGVVPAAAVLEAAAAAPTLLASVMLANHEIGTLQPIEGLAAGLRRLGVPLHADAAQAAGRVPVDVRALGVQLLTVAGHKIGGPAGAAALYVEAGTTLSPHLRGGGQEDARRPGTENVAALAAFGAAAEAARRSLTDEAVCIGALRTRLERGLLERAPGTRIHGAGARRVPNTVSATWPGVSAETLVIACDLEGLAISAGAACSSGTLGASPSVRAMGRPDEASRTVRLSLGWETTPDDIDAALGVVERVLARIHRVSGAGVSR